MLSRIQVKASGEGAEPSQKPSLYVTYTALKIAERLCDKMGIKGIEVDGSGAQFVYHSLAASIADCHQRYRLEELKEKMIKWTLSAIKNRNLFKQFVKFYDKTIAAGK